MFQSNITSGLSLNISVGGEMKKVAGGQHFLELGGNGTGGGFKIR